MKFIGGLVTGLLIGVAGTIMTMAAGFFDPVLPEPAKKDEWGSFPARPQVEFLDDGRGVRLLADFAYVDPEGRVWAATKNSIVDGASIPRPFWTVTGGPLEGEFRNASIVHDAACVSKTEPWEDVHHMFYQACRCGGVMESKAKVMYAAVYHFGPRWAFQTVKHVTSFKDAKGKIRTKSISSQVPRVIASPSPDPGVAEKLERLIADKNPSLEDLRSLDPTKL